MVRTVIRLALVALVVHAGVRIGPEFWKHFKFRDAVEDMAMFSEKRSEREIASRVMEIAGRMEIPLAVEDLRVHRSAGVTYVEASYVAPLEYFPRQYYPWQFTLSIRAVPPRYSGVLP